MQLNGTQRCCSRFICCSTRQMVINQGAASFSSKPRTIGRSGGALGRKGQETRTRLLDAALRLLQAQSAVSLTATAIAQEAQTSLATLYVYFGDVSDVLLALAQEASADITDILSAIDAWDPLSEDEEGARAFFEAYRAYWDRHKAVLVLRNMESDCGDERFAEIRNRAGLRMVEALGAKILIGHQGSGMTQEQASARSMVIFAAIERLATRETLFAKGEDGEQSALYEAQIGILREMVSK